MTIVWSPLARRRIREILFRPYRVVYEIRENRIEILTLNHARQEFPGEKPESSP